LSVFFQGRLDLGVAAAATAEDRHVGGGMVFDETEEAIEGGFQPLGRGEAGVRGGQLPQLDLAAAQGGQDEVLLGREVVVEQSFGDACRRGDLLDRDLVVGPAAEQLGAGGKQLLAARVGAHSGPPSRLHRAQAIPIDRKFNKADINSGAIELTVNKQSTGDDDLAFSGLARQAELLAAGSVGAVELFESTMVRIEASQPSLNAFRLLSAEAARAEALEAERRLATGQRLPLLGVPIAVKDDMDLAGEPTAFGCAGEFEPCREDGEVARRLRAAGAVIVGKTNTPEIGQWPFTEGPAFGATRNPWSRDHSPGGSSGGSAAAVAAGLLPAAVGSDGAGSVRIPAAWTHLVGLKPQRGRVSTWPAPESFNGLTSYGPLARTVGDAALLLDVLTGNVAGDRHCPPAPSEPFAAAANRDPGRLRIGLAFNVPFSGSPAQLDPEVRAAVESVAEALEGLGHGIEEVKVPYGLATGASIMPRSMIGIREWTERAPDRSRLDPRTHHAARLGRAFRPLLGPAHLAEKVARRRIGKVFRRFDVILAPTTAQPPLPIGACEGLGSWETDKRIVAACPYAWPWNILGWPGLNVPAGFNPDGLPLGVQLLGHENSEAVLLALGNQLEGALLWHEHRPPAVWSFP